MLINDIALKFLTQKNVNIIIFLSQCTDAENTSNSIFREKETFFFLNILIT